MQRNFHKMLFPVTKYLFKTVFLHALKEAEFKVGTPPLAYLHYIYPGFVFFLYIKCLSFLYMKKLDRYSGSFIIVFGFATAYV